MYHFKSILKNQNKKNLPFSIKFAKFDTLLVLNHLLFNVILLQKIKENDCVLFMKGTPSLPRCGFSNAVVKILEAEGITSPDYLSINVLENDEIREAVKKFSFSFNYIEEYQFIFLLSKTGTGPHSLNYM